VRGGSRVPADAALAGLFGLNMDVGGFLLYANFLVFNADYVPIANSWPTSLSNARNTPYAGYFHLAERGQTWASNVTVSSVTGLAQIWIARPFMDGNTFLGMIAIPVHTQGLSHFLKSPEYRTGRYYTVIADPTGRVAYSNRPDYLGQNLVDLGMAPSLAELPRDQLFEYTSSVSGNRDFAHLSVEPEMGWMIISGIDRSSVMATRGEIILGIFPFVLGLILSSTVMFLFVIGALRPLGLLARALNDIANGEGDLTARLQETGAKEIADVSMYFNQTLEKIRNLVQSIKMGAKTLSEIGNDLTNNMNETAAAKNKIVNNIQTIKDRIMIQSECVCHTLSIMV